ncbi:hypothetical protein MKW94_027157 [Papaver nudicaule]|uniref:Uncharacterized protein n=1 Tax=Papaver nudicaule TaxID=74823 RepID=A0AA41VPZ5_PAPNU|nr:hypothetical protein [Papaver nudicaule]
MALKDVARMLSRRFSSGTRNGGFQNKHAEFRDAKVRRFCERLEQAAENAKQLTDECDAICALEGAFRLDRLVWTAVIVNLGAAAAVKGRMMIETKKSIQDIEYQLSALQAKKQEFPSPAYSA